MTIPALWYYAAFPTLAASSALKPIRISKTRIRVPFEKKESQLHSMAATPPALALVRHATDGMDPLLAAETPGAVTASPNTLGVHSWSAAAGGLAASDGGAAGAAASASATAGADVHRGHATTPQQLAYKVVQGLWAAPTSEEMQLERAATSMAALNDEVLIRFFGLIAHVNLMCVKLSVSRKHAWWTFDFSSSVDANDSMSGDSVFLCFCTHQRKPSSPAYGRFFLSSAEMLELIGHASALFAREPSLLEISGEAKLYGDLHGMRCGQREIARLGLHSMPKSSACICINLFSQLLREHFLNRRTNARFASSAARLWRSE
jgi:hypothetical protein